MKIKKRAPHPKKRAKVYEQYRVLNPILRMRYVELDRMKFIQRS